MEGQLPNLLVIGAMKAGTTSLHDYLNQHPDIFMSEKKELDFFVEEKNWDKGVEWYKSNFKTNAKFRGESSQNYSKYHMFKGVPEKIKSVLGDDFKLLYIIRNPIDRIISQYVENLEANETDGELNSILNKDGNKYLETSLYGKQLQIYFDVIDLKKTNFKVIELEKLKTKRVEVLNDVFRFLGVREIAEELNVEVVRNSKSDKLIRHPFYHFLGSISRFGIGRILGVKFKERVKSLNVFKRKVPEVRIDDDIVIKIAQGINKDLDVLARLTSMNFDHYKT